MYNNNNFQKTTGRSRDVPLVISKYENIILIHIEENYNVIKFIEYDIIIITLYGS